MTSPAARVFIVDDHPLVREWLGSLIARETDLEVCGDAEDATTALAVLAAARADIVVVDLSLKHSSGLDLIHDLQTRFPQTAVLILSMHEETSFAERAVRAGARGYVLKRESGSSVVTAIRTVLRGQFYASEPLAAELLGRLAKSPLERVAESPADSLSERELAVFERRGLGRTSKLIAEELNVSVKTVESYEARIKQKLGLRGAGELLRAAVRWVERRHPV
jgi:DNA-binding NarL/FixJ family response regulator